MKRAVRLLALLACILVLAFSVQPSGITAAPRRQPGFWDDLRGIRDPQRVALLMLARRCGTPDLSDRQLEVNDAIEAAIGRLRGRAAVAPKTPGIVPVVFHVLHDGNDGLLSMDDILAQIDELNATYSNVEFVLADVDFSDNPIWFNMTPNSSAEHECKTALVRDPHQYLNLYTCQPGASLLGYSTFPWDLAAQPAMDGVVILFSSLPGGAAHPYDEGKSAVHEVGHWLGLYHPFQGSCLPRNDRVSDTPAERTPTFGTPATKDTCRAAGVDPIHNYMD